MAEASALSASKLFGVDGIVAVITGGGTGIGLMMAKGLAMNGASKVYILGRRLEKLQEAAKASPHGNIVPLQADVTSKDSLAAAAAQIQKEVGYINLLVCNAGVGEAMLQNAPAEMDISTFQSLCWAMDPSDFAKTYEVNLTSVFFTTIAFVHLLDAGNRAKNYHGGDVDSQLIITSSIASLLKKPLTAFAYSTSKAGVTHMGKHFGSYLSPYQIRTNVIAPGLFPSDLAAGLTAMWPDGKVPRHLVPAGRFGSEEEMAGTVLYLASRAGAFTDGCIVVPDGGLVKLAPATY